MSIWPRNEAKERQQRADAQATERQELANALTLATEQLRTAMTAIAIAWEDFIALRDRADALNPQLEIRDCVGGMISRTCGIPNRVLGQIGSLVGQRETMKHHERWAVELRTGPGTGGDGWDQRFATPGLDPLTEELKIPRDGPGAVAAHSTPFPRSAA